MLHCPMTPKRASVRWDALVKGTAGRPTHHIFVATLAIPFLGFNPLFTCPPIRNDVEDHKVSHIAYLVLQPEGVNVARDVLRP
jgi:hypothetical protein